MLETIETRPYPNEHACRLRDPADFKPDSFRRTSRKHDGKTYDVISGKLKGKDSMTEQAYRYDKKTWTAESAKSHCKDHDGKFEAAKDSKANNNGDMEVRDFAPDIGELRIDDSEQPKITGYATKYGNFYDLGWFKERIKAGAFDDVLEDDVRCLKNHDSNLILGRTVSGTLRLLSNSVGLKFENDLPDTTTGKDTREEIRRGDISGCSFAFTVAEDDWKYFDDDRPSERTIIKIGRLFDVGPVVYPANPETSVIARGTEIAKRSLEIFKENNPIEKRDESEKQKEDENKDKSEPDKDKKSNEESELISDEQQRKINKGYRKAGRILNRVTEQLNQAEV